MPFPFRLSFALPAAALLWSVFAAHAASSQDPRVTAYSRLTVENWNTSGNFKGDCVKLASDRVCLPKVMMDGHRISDLTVLNGDLAYAVRHPGTHLQQPHAVQVGVATGVFNQLLILEGPKDGVRVTTAQAQAVARRTLAYYQKHPSTMVLPIGVSPKKFFLSPTTIATYQRDLVFTAEERKIQQMYPKLWSAQNPVPAYQAFYRARLPRHTVTINGKKPTFDLPSSLA